MHKCIWYTGDYTILHFKACFKYNCEAIEISNIEWKGQVIKKVLEMHFV